MTAGTATVAVLVLLAACFAVIAWHDRYTDPVGALVGYTAALAAIFLAIDLATSGGAT